MAESKLRRWIVSGATVAVLGTIGLGVGPASSAAGACANAAPCNDNYVSSLELNRHGTKLDRVHTLRDQRDLTSATTQGNIFDPCGQSPCPHGPQETTSCHGTSYGNTVWYDLYPDADGKISIRTAAFFQNVIALYSFGKDLVPHELGCTTSNLGAGQLVATVKKRGSYTFQLGYVSGAQPPGPISMLFDYFVTPPRRLTAQTTLKVRATANGVQLVDLTVAAARGTRISVSCGGLCAPETKSVPKFGSGAQDFSGLNGVQMPGGSKLVIRVTAPHSIGAVVQYNIQPGNFSKQTFCTEPGSQQLRHSCH